MELTCMECGHSWESTKESLDDFSDGPRCSSCDSREVVAESATTGDSNSKSEAAAVFEALENGASLVEIVREDICDDPETVEEYARQFEQLSEYRLLSEDDLNRIRESSREEGERTSRGKAQSQLREYRQRNQQLQNDITQMQQQLNLMERKMLDEYESGWEEGRDALRDELREEYEEIIGDRVQELRKEHEAELAEINREVSKLLSDLDAERRANEHLVARLDAYENSDMAAAYIEGTRDLAAATEIYDEGRAKGMLETARVLTSG